MNRLSLISALLCTMLAACGRADDASAENETNAMAPDSPMSALLTSATGASAGEVALSEDANGLTLRIQAAGLPPGTHGVHLHAVGRCEGPKFESAGPHWNPAGKQHGRDNPKGAHLGDLANLDIGSDGRGSSTFMVAGAKLREGPNALLDLDGAALVIHSKADDYKTDPSGASGDRIACATLGG